MYRLVLLTAALAAACTPAPSLPGPADAMPVLETTSTGISYRLDGTTRAAHAIDAAPEHVWQALPAVFRELGLPAPEILDADARAYGHRKVSLQRIGGEPIGSFFRCGNAGAGPSAFGRHLIRFSITTVVSGGADAAEIVTHIVASGSPIDGTSTGRTICISNGGLEQKIRQLLADRLAP